MKQDVTEVLKKSVPTAIGVAAGSALAMKAGPSKQKGSLPVRILTAFLGGMAGGVIYFLGIRREK